MRKYLPTLSELIDRLSINQLKEVFIMEHDNETTVLCLGAGSISKIVRSYVSEVFSESQR